MKTKTKETICEYVFDPIIITFIILFIFGVGCIFGAVTVSNHNAEIIEKANKIILSRNL